MTEWGSLQSIGTSDSSCCFSTLKEKADVVGHLVRVVLKVVKEIFFDFFLFSSLLFYAVEIQKARKVPSIKNNDQ